MRVLAVLTEAVVAAAAEPTPGGSPTPVDATPALVGSLFGALVAMMIVVAGAWWLIRRSGR